MECTVSTAFAFGYLSLAYGVAFAIVAKGLDYFEPIMMIALRMSFGLVTCLTILLFRLATTSGYSNVIKLHFTQGFSPIFYMGFTGLLLVGLPHSLISIAQQWIPSSMVQIAQPLATAMGAIYSHFALEDEKFNMQKFYSLLCAVVGVALSAIPSFSSNTGATGMQNLIGYLLLVVGVTMFGVAPVVIKAKVPNSDTTVLSTVQTAVSTLVTWIISFIAYPSNTLFTELRTAPLIAWLWPLLVGVFCTALAIHAFVYLIAVIGSNGANLVTFGQIIVGVAVGVLFMGDWDAYTSKDITIALVGIFLLVVAIFIGVYQPSHTELAMEALSEEEEGLEEEPVVIEPTITEL